MSDILLLQEAAARPHNFVWKGPINRRYLREWIRTMGYVVPDDLVEVWVQTGGGDMFVSEVLLHPMSDPEDIESIEDRNEGYRGRGMEANYLIFEEGVFLSAIDQRNQKVVLLNSQALEVDAVYDSLDEWYASSVGAEFGMMTRQNISEDLF